MDSIKKYLYLHFDKDLIRPVLLLIILLILLLLFLNYFSKLGNSESFNVVLSISLAVFTGFFIDTVKKDWDDYKGKKKFKLTVLKLLEQDAKSIFRTYKMWGDMRKTIGKKGTPPGIEHLLPPELEMKYWNKLSQENEFLLLAEDERFEKIFRSFWDFEKLGKLISGAKGDLADQTIKQSYMLAMAISQQTLENNDTETLLGLFMDKEKIDKYKNSFINDI